MSPAVGHHPVLIAVEPHSLLLVMVELVMDEETGTSRLVIRTGIGRTQPAVDGDCYADLEILCRTSENVFRDSLFKFFNSYMYMAERGVINYSSIQLCTYT